MTRSPRFYLILGTLAAALNLILVARADAFISLWNLFDPWSWMK